jgi:hypothetical protein
MGSYVPLTSAASALILSPLTHRISSGMNAVAIPISGSMVQSLGLIGRWRRNNPALRKPDTEYPDALAGSSPAEGGA